MKIRTLAPSDADVIASLWTNGCGIPEPPGILAVLVASANLVAPLSADMHRSASAR